LALIVYVGAELPLPLPPSPSPQALRPTRMLARTAPHQIVRDEYWLIASSVNVGTCPMIRVWPCRIVEEHFTGCG